MKQLTLRLPDNLHAQLKERAEHGHRSMHAELLHLIEQTLRGEGTTPHLSARLAAGQPGNDVELAKCSHPDCAWIGLSSEVKSYGDCPRCNRGSLDYSFIPSCECSRSTAVIREQWHLIEAVVHHQGSSPDEKLWEITDLLADMGDSGHQ